MEILLHEQADAMRTYRDSLPNDETRARFDQCIAAWSQSMTGYYGRERRPAVRHQIRERLRHEKLLARSRWNRCRKYT